VVVDVIFIDITKVDQARAINKMINDSSTGVMPRYRWLLDVG
jgi:hypothetical protein